MLIVNVVTFLSCFPLFLTEDPPQIIRPVVLWHGLDDNCCDLSLNRMTDIIKREIPGTFVYSIMIGDNVKEDAHKSRYMDVNKQVSYVCRLIKGVPELRNGYNAIGFSQGSQFLRAVAQRCPFPRMFNLISFGGQHQGIFGIGKCRFCNTLRLILQKSGIAQWSLLKRKIAPLQYWHDPMSQDDEKYREENNFIAEINNEKDFNESYKQNLLRLENLVLVKFELDEAVVPVGSQWFEFYKPGQAKEILPLRESRLWLEDRLGLWKLEMTGRLHFIEFENCKHLQIPDKWFVQDIIDKYLRPKILK